MREKKSIFIIDFPKEESEDLIYSLNKETKLNWVLIEHVAKKSQSKIKDLSRYIKYFIIPFYVFLHRSSVLNLIAWQQFYGILFAFYCHLFHVKKTTHLVILTFMYTPKKSFLGKIYRWFMHYAVCNEYVDQIVCFSEKERTWYKEEFGFNDRKIAYLPVAVKKIPKFDTSITLEKYVFTAGHSGRDLDFVIRSLNNTEYKLVVADSMTTETPSENVTIDTKSTGTVMLEIMAHCYCFVTPLKSKLKSAGHLMSLQAMQMGKPVICTDSDGMRPYIIDGYNGFFIENTKEDLLSALKRLYQDHELYNRMSKNAMQTYGDYSFSKLAERIARLDDNNHFLLK